MHAERVRSRILSRVHELGSGQCPRRHFRVLSRYNSMGNSQARRDETWKLDWAAPLVALMVAAINIIWGVEVAGGRTAVKDQSPAGAYFFFGVLVLLSAAGDVRGGCRSFKAAPKCHLAPVRSVEDIPLNAWSRLIRPCDPVGRMLHEFWEIVHGGKTLSHS